MKIQDIIRSMINMIDGSQTPEEHKQIATIMVQPQEPEQDDTIDIDASPLTHADDDINRWRQIVDLADKGECTPYENTPNEKYADIEAVTTHAGGGVNGPKHPHDLRIKDPSAYPNQQEY